MLSLRKDVLREKLRKKIKFFFPCVSLLIFYAGRDSCYSIMDVLLLLGLWFSLFFFGMLIVLFPRLFVVIEN